MANEFTREQEGSSTPKILADEALKHFRRARQACGDTDEAIQATEQEVPKTMRDGKLPTLPDLRKYLQPR